MKKILISLLTVITFVPLLLGKPLVIYNWSDYIDEEILKEFTAQAGISINYKIYENNDELYKILKSNLECDIVFPSRYYVKLLKQEGHLKKLDLNKIRDLHKFDPFLLNNPSTKNYGIPYFWGSTSIIYNSSILKIESIKDLWREDLKKRVVITNDMRDMFAFALTSIGLDPNSEKEEEIQQGYKKLIELVPNIAGFNNNIDKLGIWLNNRDVFAAIAYNGDIEEFLKENKDLQFVYPKEGAVLWTDISAICSKSQREEEAYSFLNFLFSDKNIQQNTKKYGYIPPIKNPKENTLTYPTQEEKQNAIELVKIDKSYKTYKMYWEKFLKELEQRGITNED